MYYCVVNLDGHPSWTEKHPRWRLLKYTSGCVRKDVCRDGQLRGSRKMTLNVGGTFYWAAISGEQRLKGRERPTQAPFPFLYLLGFLPRVLLPWRFGFATQHVVMVPAGLELRPLKSWAAMVSLLSCSPPGILLQGQQTTNFIALCKRRHRGFWEVREHSRELMLFE